MDKEKMNEEKLHRIELSDEELAQITGGGDRLESLEGFKVDTIGCDFYYNGILYIYSNNKVYDSNGNLCEVYVAEGGGSCVLIPYF